MIVAGKCVALALLARPVLGGDWIDPAEAAAMAWRAYGDFVTYFLTGDAAPGGTRVYVTPITLQGVAAGDPVPAANTNWEIYSIADALQTVDDPYQRTGGKSYIASLDEYLRSVNVTTRTPTAAELSQLDILQSQLETAEMAMLDAELAAWQRWQLFTSNGMTTAPFAQWVTQGYPAYIRTRDAYWNADQRYQNYYRQIYGASNTNLVQQSRDITAARSRLGFVPGLNMRADPTDVSIPAQGPYAVAPEPPESNTVLVPQYGMNGLEDQVNDWLRDVSEERTSYTFRMSWDQVTDWTSLGFPDPTYPTGSDRFTLLAGRESNLTKLQPFYGWHSGFESVVELTLTLQGSPAAFDVVPGLWDQGNPRTMYPNLLNDSTDPLDGQVRVTRVLMGYRPGLKLTIRCNETYPLARDWLLSAPLEPSSEVRMFGFSLVGEPSAFISEFEDLRDTPPSRTLEPAAISLLDSLDLRPISDLEIMDDGDNGGSFEIPPSDSRRPFLLGVMGRVQ